MPSKGTPSSSSSDEDSESEEDNTTGGKRLHTADLSIPMFRSKRSRLNSFDSQRIGETSSKDRSDSLGSQGAGQSNISTKPTFKPTAASKVNQRPRAINSGRAIGTRQTSGPGAGGGIRTGTAGDRPKDRSKDRPLSGGQRVPLLGPSVHKSSLDIGASVRPPKRPTRPKHASKGGGLKLWPSLTRFYRAVLRWVYIPDQRSLHEDTQSRQRMEKLVSVPVQFDSVLQYQKVLCRLVLKECLSNLQQEVKQGEKNAAVHLSGEVCLACSLEQATNDGVAAGPPKDEKLYSLAVRLHIPSVEEGGCGTSCSKGKSKPSGTDKGRGPGRGSGTGDELVPFSGGDLVALICPGSKKEEVAPLGVVQSWDPIFDRVLPRGTGYSTSSSAVYGGVSGGVSGGGGSGSDQGGVMIRVLVCSHSSG
ncbi:unnamed protein product, partial [Choristocarpus tenellus]